MECNEGIESINSIKSIVKYYCQICLKTYCLVCKVEWTYYHNNKSCKEMIPFRTKAENLRRLRLEINFFFKFKIKFRNAEANVLTDAIIRRCSQCKIAYQKSHGCNFMTCRCSNSMCYICRNEQIKQNHFCNCGFL